MMLYLGIDQHKRFSQVAVVDDRGNALKECKLYHDDFEEMRRFFRRWSRGTAVVEATRNWDWLVEMLEEEMDNVVMSHPSKTRAIAEAKVKTDRVDARVLADLARAGYLPQAYAPSRDIRDGRALHRYRVRLVRIRTMLKNRVHTLLDRMGIQHPWTDLFGKRGREFLTELEIRQPHKAELESTIRLIDTLDDEVKRVTARIRTTVHEDPHARQLLSVPGIGVLLAHLIVFEIGDIGRFRNAKRFASYCALVPSTKQSAHRLYHGHTGKQGNLMLKWAFVEAAKIAKRHDPALATLYERLKRKKGMGKATVAIARKLAVAVFHMLKKEEGYRYNNPLQDTLG